MASSLSEEDANHQEEKLSIMLPEVVVGNRSNGNVSPPPSSVPEFVGSETPVSSGGVQITDSALLLALDQRPPVLESASRTASLSSKGSAAGVRSNRPSLKAMGKSSRASHRRVYSAVEGSVAQSCLLAGLDQDEVGASDDVSVHKPGTAEDWNLLAGIRGPLLKADPAANAAAAAAQWDPSRASDGLLTSPRHNDAIGIDDDHDEEVNNSLAGLVVKTSLEDDDDDSGHHGQQDHDRFSPLTRTTPRPTALRSTNSNSSMNSNMSATPKQQVDIVSALRSTMGDLKSSMDRNFHDLAHSHRRDLDKLLMVIQQESAKRMALEGRLHSQLLLQSETMVAMELKLLRLEAKVERRLQRRYNTSTNWREATPPFASSSMTSQNSQTNNNSMNHNPVNSSSGPVVSSLNNPQLQMQQQSFSASNTIDEEVDLSEVEVNMMLLPNIRAGSSSNHHGSRLPPPPARTGAGPLAVVSSGASLASAVSATTFLDGESTKDGHDDDDDDDGSSDDGDVEDGGVRRIQANTVDDDDSEFTPTQRSRISFATLDSILLNPMMTSNTELGMSTRATRGDGDGNSSLATSVTSATLTSTVLTATTRGADSARVSNRDRDVDEDTVISGGLTGGSVSATGGGPSTPRHHGNPNSNSVVDMVSSVPEDRPQSPLTVMSEATASLAMLPSVASASVGTSMAVAPSRAFASRRAAAVAVGESRPLANRVVSFTANDVFHVSTNTSQPYAYSEAGDSITMPDELDNLSDVADTFASSSRLWREEYEARLDAIQKRWGAD